MTAYKMRPLTRDELAEVIGWAAEEGWNPGLSDLDPFHVVDPEGFWGGFLDGRLIASISVVTYDAHAAFLGFYIVRPEYRGQGYGYALWQRAIARAAGRSVGLDGVLEQQSNYEKAGFRVAWKNIRHGAPIGALRQTLSPMAAARPWTRDTDPNCIDLNRFDRRFFPAARSAFLDLWLDKDDRHCVVETGAGSDGTGVSGYGVIRPCIDGFKIGPLFANSPETAKRIFKGLLDALPEVAGNAHVYIDPPQINDDAVELVTSLGMSPVFETVRMYNGPVPKMETDGIYGVTTGELG